MSFAIEIEMRGADGVAVTVKPTDSSSAMMITLVCCCLLLSFLLCYFYLFVCECF